MAVVKWRKSSYSGTQTDCVEVAAVSPGVAVRDSKNPGGPVLLFERAGFASFVDRVKSGRLTPA
ncbi:protein of unknown function (DUF397) [Streptoalloteichus tenebrarius]|uniref:DUF397 domain-containing protein n=1 Tax=Streptoalloteichus tenebrarius (strain ATCC 17920 / DSM 40477 / JCM 4838 / CBS 697.72 / NBRC 16177 / NCIMB 11028 / NRRL B-12390 / A12253. 1 / ISP 5477) TaxID=1933 RepID=A0ABT1HYK8_STRSD|nr:DUF397 domain-containing protein [Streptoalloteichus tenebrarius]MCP2260603.1 protein of unknown function (DUF397) [Streptoalloteichus tenebrarius]BFF01484.1 hypothetical protein GCM10020241_31590 [Streptoalloteichus tenebrarius]